jgi:hypothetical protein
MKSISPRRGFVLAGVSSSLVAAIQYFPYHTLADEFLQPTLGGVVAGQITILAIWASWSPVEFWKRGLLVVAYGAVPTYLVLVREWWFGGTWADSMSVYLLDAIVLLVLVAVLTPARWLRGNQLSFSKQSTELVGPGRFRLAELFGLTLIVAAALALMMPAGAKNIPTRELIFQGALLALMIGFVAAIVFPCMRIALQDRFRPFELVLLTGYLLLAVILGSEIVFQFINALRGPIAFPYNAQIRLMSYLFGAGFVTSVLASLVILRFAGIRLTHSTCYRPHARPVDQNGFEAPAV